MARIEIIYINSGNLINTVQNTRAVVEVPAAEQVECADVATS